MSNANSAISYPLVTGFRFGPASVSADFQLPGGQSYTFRGWKSLNYSRTRDRATVRGFGVNPIGKTRGENSFDADCEIFLEEFNELITMMGPGYADQQFTILVHMTEGENDIQDQLIGCTLDSTESAVQQGTDALTRKFKLSPLQILFNGIDDVAPQNVVSAD